jgi:DNA-binding transcriptional ArsR family regulator
MSRPPSSENVFRAVAHPIRREVLELLRRGDRPASQLVTSLGTSRPNVSQHLRVLRHAGLISFRRQGTTLMYRLNRAALSQASNWFKSMERQA